MDKSGEGIELPNVDNAVETVNQLANAIQEAAKTSVNTLPKTQGPPHKILAGLDMGILGAAALELVLFTTTSEYVYFGLWWLMCLAVMGKSAFSLHLSGVFARVDIKKIITSVDGLFLILSLTFTFFFADAIIFLAIAIGIHTLLDLVKVQRPALRLLIPDFEKHAGVYCDKLDSKMQKKALFTAAVLEIMSVLFVPFYGGFITFCIYVVFLVLRYRSDSSTQEVFVYIDDGIESLTKLPHVPVQVAEYYKKMKDVMKKNIAA